MPPKAEGETKAAQRKIKALEAELEHVKAAKKAKSKSPSNEVEPSGFQSLHDVVLSAHLRVNRAIGVYSPTERGITS